MLKTRLQVHRTEKRASSDTFSLQPCHHRLTILALVEQNSINPVNMQPVLTIRRYGNAGNSPKVFGIPVGYLPLSPENLAKAGNLYQYHCSLIARPTNIKNRSIIPKP